MMIPSLLFQQTIKTTDGLTRSYLLHIPNAYRHGRTFMPLLFMFHGALGTGSQIFNSSKIRAQSELLKFIVCAPDGIDNRWNSGTGVNADIDDVGFIDQLLAKLKSELPLSEKFYISGMSNGGMLTHNLLCQRPGVFAGAASICGPIATNVYVNNNLSSAPPILGIQGGADPFVPIDGGETLGKDSGHVESAETTMGAYALMGDCGPVDTVQLPPSVDDGTSVTRYEFRDPGGVLKVRYYVVAGMGHQWPPNDPFLPSICGPTSQNLNATLELCNFFFS